SSSEVANTFTLCPVSKSSLIRAKPAPILLPLYLTHSMALRAILLGIGFDWPFLRIPKIPQPDLTWVMWWLFSSGLHP
ncbi:MAG: hypothetical protein QXZ00_04710, partial [Nitrososphaerota archaeon]